MVNVTGDQDAPVFARARFAHFFHASLSRASSIASVRTCFDDPVPAVLRGSACHVPCGFLTDSALRAPLRTLAHSLDWLDSHLHQHRHELATGCDSRLPSSTRSSARFSTGRAPLLAQLYVAFKLRAIPTVQRHSISRVPTNRLPTNLILSISLSINQSIYPSINASLSLARSHIAIDLMKGFAAQSRVLASSSHRLMCMRPVFSVSHALFIE